MSEPRSGHSWEDSVDLTVDDDVDDDVATLRQPLSPTDQENREDDDDLASRYLDSAADYSTQLDDILGDDEHEGWRSSIAFDDKEDADEGFFYSGVDATAAGGYRQQLRDVLGPEAEHDSDDESNKMFEAAINSFAYEDDELGGVRDTDDKSDEFSYERLSRMIDEPSLSIPSSPISRPSLPSTPTRKSFLNPTVSRLRSFTPRMSSLGSYMSNTTLISTPPSHMSTLSRSSTASNLRQQNSVKPESQEAFRWSTLHSVGEELFRKATSESDGSYGQPTVMGANGMICIGTERGRVLVFDFKQRLKCICGSPAISQEQGAVTAVALTQDQTFVAAGHASGHIFLYNLAKPTTPVRSVPTTTMSAVASGRKEGHLANVSISRIGFVGKRHTAIVSSDENGLAFYHSLGKALFFEATDVLRVLGKYPEKEVAKPTASSASSQPRQRKSSAILAMAPLPLGVVPDSVDEYILIALLTPIKLIIVGLKPSPRTWYRQHRELASGSTESKWRGCLAWFPRVKVDDATTLNGKKLANANSDDNRPTLVYTWGNSFFLLRVREQKSTSMVKNPRTGKDVPVTTGKVLFDEQLRWTADADLLAVQWLTANLVVGCTSQSIGVWDIHTGTCIENSPLALSLMSMPVYPADDSANGLDPASDLAHSVRTHKGKVFLLVGGVTLWLGTGLTTSTKNQDGVKVGTLMTWADKILMLVQKGDFLSSIDLARAYYMGDAPGNRIGLPSDVEALREVVGVKMRELMLASANYAFSEDRLTDETHVTVDGRGVDRTSLFEGIVSHCAKACVALNDLDFLYDDLFERYSSWGITSIFLNQIEPFVLDNTINFVPPRITQQIIAQHAARGDFAAVEKLIWHIDPQCLDIDQAINLCKRYDLWDAMIYVYCAALHDYVSPVVELLGLIRRLQQHRRQTLLGEGLVNGDGEQMDKLVPTAYKIFGYLANVLSGLAFPSEMPLREGDALAAKREIYSFLFFGRASVWPKGEEGKLVLTADVDGEIEPTYPYLRLLLRFDAEACLHSLDLAFEDSFLNDRSHNVSRLVIVKILLELRDSRDLSSADATFINIFIARNVPKYPQYMDLVAPSALQSILTGLIRDPDPSTRDDREFAAEFLLSVYNPQRDEVLIRSLQKATFYRILRSWFKQDHRWRELLQTYVDDADIAASDLFSNVRQVFETAEKQKGRALQDDLSLTFIGALPQFLDSSITETASLVERYLPREHGVVLREIGEKSPHRTFAYLRTLLEPGLDADEDVANTLHPSPNLQETDRQEYIRLLCMYEPQSVIRALGNALPLETQWSKMETICEDAGVYGAVVWSQDSRRQPAEAFSSLKRFNYQLAQQFVSIMGGSHPTSASLDVMLSSQALLDDVAVEICRTRATCPDPKPQIAVEEMWLATLASQIDSVQIVSGCSKSENLLDISKTVITALRLSVQQTFAALMSLGSSSDVEFPHLFKRLVDATSFTRSTNNPSYAEFRIILSGMLESYRFEEDVLLTSTQLIGRDLLDAIADLSRTQNKGWRPSLSHCQQCNKEVVGSGVQVGEATEQPDDFVIVRTGLIYHKGCWSPTHV